MLAEMRKRYPGLPLFLVGTSRGTLSVAHLAAALGGEVSGAVLTASLFHKPWRTRLALLSGFDWSAIKTPVLLVHHSDDGCRATPYFEAQRLAGRFPLVTVKGGKQAESDAIAAWMLGKPFAREIR